MVPEQESTTLFIIVKLLRVKFNGKSGIFSVKKLIRPAVLFFTGDFCIMKDKHMRKWGDRPDYEYGRQLQEHHGVG